MFSRSFLEGFEEGECVKLIKGVYYAGLCGDFYSLKFLVIFKVHGLNDKICKGSGPGCVDPNGQSWG